jgi:hypothetical protein
MVKATMKRLNVLNQPTNVADLADIDSDNLTDGWQLKAERWETRRLRKFRRQAG